MFRKRWLLCVLFGFLLTGTLGFGPPTQPPRQGDEVSMVVSAGFDGYYRAGEWLPLQVSLRNEGSDLRGTLQVRSRSSSSGIETIYETPVTLARSSPKTIFLYVSLSRRASEIELELLDEDGRIVRRQRENITEIAARDVLYGVVTDSSLGWVDLTGETIGVGRVYQSNWTLRDIPLQAESLRALDALILFDVDTSDLQANPERFNAIKLWVLGGGHLIIHGGSGAELTAAGLGELLPVELQGSTTLETLEPLGVYLGHPSDVLAARVRVSQNVPLPEAKTLFSIEGVPFLVRQDFGAGTIDFVAVDPQAGALRDYAELDVLWFELVSSAPIRPSWSYGFGDWDTADRAVRIVTGFELPSAGQMLLFLSVYIFLIGIGNYLFLRALKRLELAWVTIPVLIIVFTLIAYFTGFSLRGDDPTVNHLSVVQGWHGSEVARVDSLVGLFSPRRATYNLLAEAGFAVRTLPLLSNLDTSGINEITVRESSTYQVTDLPVDAGIVARFNASGYVPTPRLGGEVTWQLGNGETLRISGQVFNQEAFVLEDAVILLKDGFWSVGNIEAGQTRSFGFEIALQEPTLVPLGSRTPATAPSPVYFRGRNQRTTAYDNFYPSQITFFNCGTGGSQYTLSQVMNGQSFDCLRQTGSDDERILRRRALLLSSINNEIDFSGGRAGDVYLVGWGTKAPYRMSLEDTGQRNESETLYIMQLKSEFVSSLADNMAIYVPPGLMTWTLVEQEENSSLDVSPYYLQPLSLEGQAIFRFMPVATLPLGEINRLELSANVGPNSQFVEIALWNWEKGEWVTQEFGTRQQLWLREPAPYLGPNNAVHVLVRSTIDSGIYNLEIEVALRSFLLTEG